MSPESPRGNESVVSTSTPGPVRRSHVDIYEERPPRPRDRGGDGIWLAVAVLVVIALLFFLAWIF